MNFGLAFGRKGVARPSRLAFRIDRWCSSHRTAWALISSISCLAALALLHHQIRDGGAVRALYLVPIWLATRNGGRAAGLAMVGLTVVVDLLAEGQFAHGYPSVAAAREAILLVLALGVLTILIAQMESSLSQVRRMAMLDPLTGLLNRRALGEFAHQALYGEPGETEPVTVVVIDCDGFKELNDTYGHTAGDHVLQMLARTLQYETRKNDLVARIGGDEFVVVLRGTTAAEAKSIMERVEALFETHVRNAGYACTISVGYSPSSDQTESIEALMEQADRAMYARKERKRSRAYLR